ncbi:MAG: energy transducer TonB [Burkholderiaceae bacterium]
MTAVVSTRRARHRWHAPEKGSGPAFALSLLAHALLFIAIAYVVRWKSEPVGAVAVELWSAPPTHVSQSTPAPPPKVEPPPEPVPRKVDIVIEQKKAPPNVELKKPPEPPKKTEAKKTEAKAAPIERPPDPNPAVQRALAQAQRASVAITGASSGGLSEGYAAQIRGCIRPHIIFNVPDGIHAQQHVADFEVMLLPTGEQATEPKLLKASGLAAYDQAVERAIRRCNPFPPPKEGTMPRSLRLSFDPVENR